MSNGAVNSLLDALEKASANLDILCAELAAAKAEAFISAQQLRELNPDGSMNQTVQDAAYLLRDDDAVQQNIQSISDYLKYRR